MRRWVALGFVLAACSGARATGSMIAPAEVPLQETTRSDEPTLWSHLGVSPDAELVNRLKDRVGEIVSKPFRPREIHFVEALPKTRSMKTMRRVVRAAFLGEDPGDLSSISNPETIQPIADLQKEKS